MDLIKNKIYGRSNFGSMFLIFLLLLITLQIFFNQLYADEEKKDKKQEVVEAEGRAFMGELDTIKELEIRAEKEAERDAIEKAVGVFIKSKTLVYNETLLEDLIDKTAAAKIVKKEIIFSGWEKPAEVYLVKIKAYVEEVELEKEGSLNVEVYLSKRELKAGDEVKIIYKCNSDCYVNIFNVSDDGEVTLLFPNKVCKNNFCEKGKTYIFPSEEDKKKGVKKLVAKLPKNKTKSRETIKIIATRKDIEIVRSGFKEGIFEIFTKEDTGIVTGMVTDLIYRLSRLSPTEWGEASFVYEINRN
jgi:hypothetical protein